MPEVALFGGSFDPPHVGHLLAATYVLATEPIDDLWLVPVFQHPFGKQFAASYDHRVLLCEKLGFEVSRAEQESGQSRTVDLLEWMHNKYTNYTFALVLGTDLKAERAQWKNFDRIQQLARIVELHRGGFTQGEVTLPEVSSTEVRARLKRGEDVSHLVPRAVLAAIRAAGTYS